MILIIEIHDWATLGNFSLPILTFVKRTKETISETKFFKAFVFLQNFNELLESINN